MRLVINNPKKYLDIIQQLYNKISYKNRENTYYKVFYYYY
jgi:hypothetical protein